MDAPETVIGLKWDSQERRCGLGREFGFTPLLCQHCAREVAVPLDIWRLWRYDRNRYRIVCEPCAMLLEIHPTIH
jgi:hypothetical protein